jgi:hypothetical protein
MVQNFVFWGKTPHFHHLSICHILCFLCHISVDHIKELFKGFKGKTKTITNLWSYNNQGPDNKFEGLSEIFYVLHNL